MINANTMSNESREILRLDLNTFNKEISKIVCSLGLTVGGRLRICLCHLVLHVLFFLSKCVKKCGQILAPGSHRSGRITFSRNPKYN